MSVPSPPVGVVLAGGRSARMGVDKALMSVDGVPMALRVARALIGGGCNPVWCQGGDVDALAAIGLAVVPDEHPHEGPTKAILAAIDAAAPADVVVSACDLPGLDGDTVALLVTEARARPHAKVVVAGDESGAHLVAWWRSTSRDSLAELVAGGTHSYRDALRTLEAVVVAVPRRTVRNVNRPDDIDDHSAHGLPDDTALER